MLIDVHAHFYPEGTRVDAAEVNQRRLSAGDQIGITTHVASVLGSWGRHSPTYFPSPADCRAGNAWLRQFEAQHPDRVRGYVCVNPNFTGDALEEIDTGLEQGMVGIKLAASRRADDPCLDPIAELAARHRVPILHHIWQHRRRDWPGQEASDGVELVALARRHPEVSFILAHIGGGGDWSHTLRAIKDVGNVSVDLSGSGVDGGMLEACLTVTGPERLLFGCDLTIDTGLGKLRRLERLLSVEELEMVRSGNAVRIFPTGSFGDAIQPATASKE